MTRSTSVFITGLLLGALVVRLHVAANRPLGAGRADVWTMTAVRHQSDAVGWRVWFVGGIFVDGLLAKVLGAPIDAGHLKLS